MFVKRFVIMVENIAQRISRKTWYKWSFYINIVLFFIIALFICLLVIDAYNAGTVAAQTPVSTQQLSQAWVHIARDIGFLSVALALVFFQFFRNLLIIMRRSL